MGIENTEVTNDVSNDVVEGTSVDSGNVAPVEEIVESIDESVKDEKEVEKVVGEGIEEDIKPEVPPYTPNFKYKVLGQEMELPEEVRSFIKDQKSEELFRKLHEKAGAVDHFINRNKEVSTKYEDVNTKYTEISNALNELKEVIQNEDYETFFEELGIPVDKVTAFCAKRLQMQQSPEQFKAYTLQRDLDKKTRENQRMIMQQKEYAEQQNINMIRREYENTMSISENAAFMAEFDKRAGRVGAFKDEIILRGDYAVSQGKFKTTAEIVKELRAQFGSQSSGPTSPTAGGPTSPTGSSGKKPVVPVITGSSGAPVSTGKKVKSLEDLQKLRDALE